MNDLELESDSILTKLCVVLWVCTIELFVGVDRKGHFLSLEMKRVPGIIVVKGAIQLPGMSSSYTWLPWFEIKF